MKAFIHIRKQVLIPVWILLLLFAACTPKTTEEAESSQSVRVMVMQTGNTAIANDLEFTGVVQAYEEAWIGASMPARIEKILVDVGDFVTKGQLLVQMDKTQLFQARIQLQTLENDLKRMDTLLALGAVTRQAHDQLKAQYDIAASNIENLLKTTEIRATIPGVVTGRYHSAGEIFTMTPGPAGKPAIVSVMQIRPVKINIGVSERFFTQVKTGQPAQVTSDVFPGRTFDGRVSMIYPNIDRSSGTFRVEITVDNADLALRPGMFSRVALNLGQTEGIMVPALAVLKQSGSNERYVFVIENGKAIRKSVVPGRNIDDLQVILSGLEEGETLVVTGQHNLSHLTEVEIVK